MSDRRFAVVLTPEGVEIREDLVGYFDDAGQAFREAKRMAGWPMDGPIIRSLAEDEARRRRGLPVEPAHRPHEFKAATREEIQAEVEERIRQRAEARRVN